MKHLLLTTVLLFTACSVNTKFITTETAIKTLTSGKSINYDRLECNLLYFDSLQSLQAEFAFDLLKSYRNIEDLMNDLVKSYQSIDALINHPPDSLTKFFEIFRKSDIQIPILKYKDKILVKGDFSEGYGGIFSYILELIKPQKLKVTVVDAWYITSINPELTSQPRLLTQEDCATMSIPPEFDREGFEEFLQQNLNYPESAEKDSIQVWVDVSFWVETDLTTSNYEIFQFNSSINENMDNKVREDFCNEALRVAKLITVAKPGCQYGDPNRIIVSDCNRCFAIPACECGEPVRDKATVLIYFEPPARRSVY